MSKNKKDREKKGLVKKSASREKMKVTETLSCGCCMPVFKVDECGCMETRICC